MSEHVFSSEQSPPAITMTVTRAERLTKLAGEHLDVMADAYEQVLPIMRELYEGQAFRALGYKSHGAYLLDRFGATLTRLGINARRLAVLELTNQGMSVRAIAGVLDVSVGTVQSDRSEVFSLEQLPMPELTIGLDGKEHPSTKPTRELSPSVELWKRFLVEDEERVLAWCRGERNDLFGGSLWELHKKGKFASQLPADVPRWAISAAAFRSGASRQIAMAMWIKERWAEDEDAQREHQKQDPTWPYDRYDSWQSCIRDVLLIDPYAAVYAGIIADA
jgi:hypothetical protein